MVTAIAPRTVRPATMGDVHDGQQFRTDTGWATAVGDAKPTEGRTGFVTITRRTLAGVTMTNDYRAARPTTIKL
ncbi:hypothetical protein [Actinomadura violacea]|uniref:Uncharacterized protein n=1 Tax=Actinomadura violacea TaxID=2819934 RepID=A0ABS3RXZ5_9ACTN|nr:hypothetical protein [Actinomadura violacea]MBO2461629.1 hypothetical protein [Actinomadura violacea]